MTDLAGAGTPAAENESILSTPATFAAHWNRHTEEQRAELLARLRGSAETAARCFAQDHDGYREHAERLALLLTTVRECCMVDFATPPDQTDYQRGRSDVAAAILNLTDPPA